MSIKTGFFAGAALALATLFGTAAQATVIYQSIPDLTVAPFNDFCSQCTGTGDGQNVGQFFTLGSGAVAHTLTFAVGSGFVWPTSVTIDFFRDAGGSTLGANIFDQTFSTFVSDTPTGNGTDLVTVSLGSLALAAGSYDLFMTNTANLGIPGFTGGPDDQIFQQLGAGGGGPSAGDQYSFVGAHDGGTPSDSAVLLAGVVPEPAIWAMMLAGLAGLGAMLRSDRRRAISVAT